MKACLNFKEKQKRKLTAPSKVEFVKIEIFKTLFLIAVNLLQIFSKDFLQLQKYGAVVQISGFLKTILNVIKN